MSEPLPSLDDWLFDDQFDQLSAARRAELQEALARDAGLASRGRRLQRLLEPLDSWTTPPPPENLVDRVLDRLAAHGGHVANAGTAANTGTGPAGASNAGRTWKTATAGNAADRAVSNLPSGADGFFSPVGTSLKDLLALAAVIALFFAIFVPGISSVRDRSRRVACAGNLGRIGRALGGYAAANDNALPYVHMITGGSWLPASDAGLPYSPNSRSRYLLLKLRYVGDARSFICPSRAGAVPLKVRNPQALNDFPDPRNCSYDSLNMAGATPRYSKLCNLPYMADANPLFAGGRFHRINPAVANSRNHRGARGQNVLCFNGTVAWFETPNCGRNRDNIWQVGSVTVYKGTEAQTRDDDTFLTP